MTPPIILRCCEKVFTKPLPSNDKGTQTVTDGQTLLWYDMDRKEKARPTIILLLSVFFAAGTCLPSRWLATIQGYTYKYGDWWERFMKYAIEMGSGAMICILIFIKIGSGVQSWYGGIHIHRHTDTHRQQGDLISLLLFFKITLRTRDHTGLCCGLEIPAYKINIL
jgi:hypothetical protein